MQNTMVYRTILYEIAKPKDAKFKRHPDVSSLEVVSARTKLDLNFTMNFFFLSAPITIYSFKKVINTFKNSTMQLITSFSVCRPMLRDF